MPRRPKFAARNVAAAPIGSAGAVLALLFGAGCFNPGYVNDHLQCAGPLQSCPEGFHCAANGRCWRNGEDPLLDGGIEPDAPPNDGPDLPPATPPVIIDAASATPSPVQDGNTTQLSVLAEDPSGEGSQLIYSWMAVGPKPVAFTNNNSPAAKDTTAVFDKAGHYVFTVTIRNARGGMIASQVEVDMQSKLNDIALTPLMATVSFGATVQFMAKGFDQFGDDMVLPMPPVFQLAAGPAGPCGTVNETGLFTAGNMMASGCTLFATSAGITRAAPVAVGTTPPIELQPIADTYAEERSPDTNFGGSTVLHVKSQPDTNNNRITFLKFNLTGASLPLGAAKLRMFGRAFGGTHLIAVHAVADTTWNETMLTWRNKPALGVRQSRINVTTAPKYHEWDLTTHIRERLAARDTVITLGVFMEAPSSTDPDLYDSREATNRPQLVLSPMP